MITFGRRWRIVALLLALVLVTAACGSDDDDAPTATATGSTAGSDTGNDSGAAVEDPTPDAATPPPEESEEPATRSVVDFNGDAVEIPAAPEVVVTLGNLDAVHLQTLGLKPIATSAGMERTYIGLDDDLVPSDSEEFLALPVITGSDGLDLEVIAGLQPDLIVGDEFRADSLELLQEIAPTVLITYVNNGGWRERTATYAEMFGRQDVFADVEADYEAFIADLPEGLTDLNVAFVRARPEGTFLVDSPPSAFPGSVAADAGLTAFVPEGVTDSGDSGFYELSGERLGVLNDADILVVPDFSFGGLFDRPDGITLFEEYALWDRLPAVQNGAVVQIPGRIYNGGNYYAAKQLLRELAEMVVTLN